ncbi:elongation factor Tu [Gordonia neofelifaecis]|uniref:Elongation factor Tu n=1 Tax=Gordonia neofelifaecis NRRL B-59395 TaxID=644548 RepID=F1YEH0_9ACTN|nr:elongation factor Tu [Gordonia neofelifaecis]EGD56803.1 elongation factor Tu [Gordonia neofelifaecis NRRL B-59395]
MGFFSRKTEPGPVVDPTGPFAFGVEDVFSITGRGLMFTGSVESGAVVRGADAELVFGDRVLPVRIGRLESRKRRKPQALNAGYVGAIGLDGLDKDDLPRRFHGEHVILDTAALRGGVIRSPAGGAPPETGSA